MKETIKPSLALAGLASVLILTGLSCPGGGGGTQDGGFYISFDQAENWEQRVYVRDEGEEAITIDSIDVDNIQIDPTNEEILYLDSQENGVFKTVNRGENWYQTGFTSGRVRSLAIDATNTDVLYLTSGPSILMSEDGGSVWTEILTDSGGVQMTNVAVDSFDSSIIWATTADGTIYKTTDKGNNWKVNTRLPNGIRWFKVSPDDTRVIYAAVADDGLYRTTNKGRTWVKDEMLAAIPNTGNVLHLELDPQRKERLLVVTRHGLLLSEDGGGSWNTLETLIGVDSAQYEEISAITVDFPRVIVFSLNNTLHKSTNGGTTWRTVTSFPSTRLINDLEIDPNTPTTIYAGVHEVEEKKGGFFLP